jgi:hypothetical protein
MRRLLFFLALVVPCFGATEINVAVFRFRPEDKARLLAPIKVETTPAKLFTGKAELILGELQCQGAAAMIYKASELAADPKPKTIEKSEGATVVLPGEAIELPKVTRVAVKFEVSATPAGEDLALAWKGSVQWTPELLDRLAKLEALPALQTNSVLVKAFAPAGDVAGFEYPVLKQTHFDSSKIVREGELVFTTTIAETGGRRPEFLVLAVWAFKR